MANTSASSQPHIHSRATTALVIAIIGIFVLQVILGAIAVYQGTRARGDIDYSRGQLTGRNRASAAIVIGIIDIVLGVIAAITAVVLVSTV